MMTRSNPTVLGLRANWHQFWLLVLVNAFVGATVGLERTVLPLLAERDFGLASRSAVLSFIVTFGLVKAASNYYAGQLGASGEIASRFGLRPAPFYLGIASWHWV